LICRYLLEKAVVSNSKRLCFLKNGRKEVFCQERDKKTGQEKLLFGTVTPGDFGRVSKIARTIADLHAEPILRRSPARYRIVMVYSSRMANLKR